MAETYFCKKNKQKYTGNPNVFAEQTFRKMTHLNSRLPAFHTSLPLKISDPTLMDYTKSEPLIQCTVYFLCDLWYIL